MLSLTEQRIKGLYDEYRDTGQDWYLDFLDEVMITFGFDANQAYEATEFLFKYENMD